MSYPELKIIQDVLLKYRESRDNDGDHYHEIGHSILGWKTIREQRLAACDELDPFKIEDSKSVEAWFKYVLKLEPDPNSGERRLSQVRQWLQGYVLSHLLSDPESLEYQYVTAQPEYSKDKFIELITHFKEDKIFEVPEIRKFLPYSSWQELQKAVNPSEEKQYEPAEKSGEPQTQTAVTDGDAVTETLLTLAMQPSVDAAADKQVSPSPKADPSSTTVISTLLKSTSTANNTEQKKECASVSPNIQAYKMGVGVKKTPKPPTEPPPAHVIAQQKSQTVSATPSPLSMGEESKVSAPPLPGKRRRFMPLSTRVQADLLGKNKLPSSKADLPDRSSGQCSKKTR